MNLTIKILLLASLIVAAALAQPNIQPPNGTIVGGNNITFTWAPAWNHTSWLQFGTTGCASIDMGQANGTTENFTIGQNGHTGTLWFTLYWYTAYGTWTTYCNSYPFAALGGTITITAPNSGSQLTSPTQSFFVTSSYCPYYITTGWSGPGSSEIGYNVGICSGNFWYPQGLPYDAVHPITYIRACAGGQCKDYSYMNTRAPINDGTVSSVIIEDGATAIDDYDGARVPMPSSSHPIIASRHKTITLKGGAKYNIKRADLMPFDHLAWKHEQSGDSYHYTWEVDNTAIWILRIGAPEDESGFAKDATWAEPAGWTNTKLFGWAAGDNAKRNVAGKYEVTSRYRPGIFPLYMQTDVAKEPAWAKEDDSDTNIRIAQHDNVFTNSRVEYVIGPAFAPDATKAQVMEIVERWVKGFGFDPFQPLLDGKPLDSVEPVTDLEKQAIECLRAIL